MKLFDAIQAKCDHAPKSCELSLPELITSDWDRVAFVRMHASGVAAGIGVVEYKADEFEEAILFLKGEKVIDKMARIYNPERAYNGTVFLDFTGIKGKWAIFQRDSARFMAELEPGEGISNYLLHPLAK